MAEPAAASTMNPASTPFLNDLLMTALHAGIHERPRLLGFAAFDQLLTLLTANDALREYQRSGPACRFGGEARGRPDLQCIASCLKCCAADVCLTIVLPRREMPALLRTA